MTTTGEVITDDEGARWPITGLWCEACGMPLHIALVDLGIHPNCAEALGPKH